MHAALGGSGGILLATYFRIVTVRLIFSEHRDYLLASLISVSLQVSYAKVAEVARRLGGTSQRTGRVWAEVQSLAYLKRGERSRVWRPCDAQQVRHVSASAMK